MSEYAIPPGFTPPFVGRPLLFRSVPVRVSVMEPQKDWAALAREIKRRRVILGFQRQKAFAEQLPFGARLLGELENGRRGTYEDTTLSALETALYWAPGSIAKVLAGDAPTELPLPVPPASPLADKADAELVAEISERIAELTRRLPRTDGAVRPDLREHLGKYAPEERREG